MYFFYIFFLILNFPFFIPLLFFNYIVCNHVLAFLITYVFINSTLFIFICFYIILLIMIISYNILSTASSLFYVLYKLKPTMSYFCWNYNLSNRNYHLIPRQKAPSYKKVTLFYFIIKIYLFLIPIVTKK